MITQWKRVLSVTCNALGSFIFFSGINVDQGRGPREKLGPRAGRAGRELRGTYPGPDPQGPGHGELKSCSFNLLALQEDQAVKRELVPIKPPRFPRRRMRLGDCWFSALKGSLGRCSF